MEGQSRACAVEQLLADASQSRTHPVAQGAPSSRGKRTQEVKIRSYQSNKRLQLSNLLICRARQVNKLTDMMTLQEYRTYFRQ